MKSNNDGFVYVECIVSLSIIVIAAYILSSCANNCYKRIELSLKERELMNVARGVLEDNKYNIRNFEFDTIDNTYNENINGYTTESTIEKLEDYYRCYKVNVKVSDNNNNRVELNSYVTQK